MLVTRTSILTTKVNQMEIPVTQEQLDEFHRSNKLIQDFFPDLTPDQREFILNGITPEEWEEAFPEDEDDGEY